MWGCSFTALLVDISDTVLGVILKLGVPFGFTKIYYIICWQLIVLN